MIKVKVATGVYMVHVPEIGLDILCGCPMDTTKLLTRRGVVQKIEDQGMIWESGPNAILLSDVSIQNGTLCNLIEFPILHMMYKQGMILPDHPNNTGRKPMIIGLKEQVKAQFNYFIRGKYGLVSLKELMEAGYSKEEAAEMMRLKIRFNHNRMQTAGEMLDYRYTDFGRTEIFEGLYIKRMGFNSYTFSYKGETANVDLGLLSHERYDSTYNLGFHIINNEYFSIVHLGDGNGWDSNNPCMGTLLTYQGKFYLIDAGPGLHSVLSAAGVSVSQIEGIFHTHCHDDHFAGLTYLIRSDHKIKYYATKPVRHSVVKKLGAVLNCDEGMFDRSFETIDLESDVWNDIDGLEVQPCFSPHPVETTIFHFRTAWEEGYVTYGHLADICSERVFKDFLTDNPREFGLSEEIYRKTRENYLRSVNLKKIDIGGGLIHGDAIDFKDDKSEKILLSHIERELNSFEKEIGSSATFALQDVLIPARENFNLRQAAAYLLRFFPGSKAQDITLFLNCSIENVGVGNILLKKGDRPDNIFILITGLVEVVSSENGGINSQITTGSFIGGVEAVMGNLAEATYIASSYITVLKIPRNLYLHYIEKNNLKEDMVKTHNIVAYLEERPIFGTFVSYHVQTHIARNLESLTAKSGEDIDVMSRPGLYIVKNGAVAVFHNAQMLELYTPGDFFGEESVVVKPNVVFEISVMQDSEIYFIPEKIIRDIPIIQWLFLESYETKSRRLKQSEEGYVDPVSDG